MPQGLVAFIGLLVVLGVLLGVRSYNQAQEEKETASLSTGVTNEAVASPVIAAKDSTQVAAAGNVTASGSSPLQPGLEALKAELAAWKTQVTEQLRTAQNATNAGAAASTLRTLQSQLTPAAFAASKARHVSLTEQHRDLKKRAGDKIGRLSPQASKLAETLLAKAGQDLVAIAETLAKQSEAANKLDGEITSLIAFHDQAANISGSQQAAEALQQKLSQILQAF